MFRGVATLSDRLQSPVAHSATRLHSAHVSSTKSRLFALFLGDPGVRRSQNWSRWRRPGASQRASTQLFRILWVTSQTPRPYFIQSVTYSPEDVFTRRDISTRTQSENKSASSNSQPAEQWEPTSCVLVASVSGSEATSRMESVFEGKAFLKQRAVTWWSCQSPWWHWLLSQLWLMAGTRHSASTKGPNGRKVADYSEVILLLSAQQSVREEEFCMKWAAGHRWCHIVTELLNNTSIHVEMLLFVCFYFVIPGGGYIHLIWVWSEV